MKNKIIKIALLLIFIFLIILIFIFVKNKYNNNDGLKYNNNKSFIKEQTVKGIVFKNIKCKYDGKDSFISYTMVNNTNKEIYLNNYDVIVKDKNNVRLTKIAAHVTDTLKPKKSLDMVNKIVGIDLTEAYYMELILNTEKEQEKSN